MSKRRIFGLPFPVFIGILVILFILLIVSFMAGPVGESLLSRFGVKLSFPSWMVVPRPEPSLPAEEVFTIFGFPVTNSIVGTWVTIVVLVGLSFLVTRRMKVVPGRLQAAFEFLLGWLINLCEGVAGEKNGRQFFPIVATIFLFVSFNAWLSLLPGFGSITIVNPEGHEVHLLRGANTDINLPLALALASFIFVEFFGLKAHGIRYIGEFINVGPFFRSLGQIFTGRLRAGLSGLLTGIIAIFVGLLEGLSHFVRIISFTFRLFGNMTAGEILLLIVAFLVPWVMALPFYGLELLVGFVQALIFAALTLVFLAVAIAPHDEETHSPEKETH